MMIKISLSHLMVHHSNI